LTATQSGYVLIMDADGKTVTLPTAASGLMFTIMNVGTSGAIGVTIAPQATDIIQLGDSARDVLVKAKSLKGAKTNSKTGYNITLLGTSATQWLPLSIVGSGWGSTS
jgi:hypothetical protein